MNEIERANKLKKRLAIIFTSAGAFVLALAVYLAAIGW